MPPAGRKKKKEPGQLGKVRLFQISQALFSFLILRLSVQSVLTINAAVMVVEMPNTLVDLTRLHGSTVNGAVIVPRMHLSFPLFLLVVSTRYPQNYAKSVMDNYLVQIDRR